VTGWTVAHHLHKSATITVVLLYLTDPIASTGAEGRVKRKFDLVMQSTTSNLVSMPPDQTTYQLVDLSSLGFQASLKSLCSIHLGQLPAQQKPAT
jgi:hypothetical protein